MKNGIQGLFPTPIYFAMVDNVLELKDEFNRVSQSFHFYDTPDMWGKPHKLTTQNFEDNIIEIKQMKVINKVVDTQITSF